MFNYAFLRMSRFTGSPEVSPSCRRVPFPGTRCDYFFHVFLVWCFLDFLGALGSFFGPRMPNIGKNGNQNQIKIVSKLCFFGLRSTMWFCIPLQHGILIFMGPRHPKSEENPMKNRVREQTLSHASFLSLLGPLGRPKAPKKLPEGCPTGSQRESKMEPELGSEALWDAGEAQ